MIYKCYTQYMLRLRIFLTLIFISVVIGGLSIPFFIKDSIAFTIPRINKTITIEPTDQATFKTESAAQISQLTERAQTLGSSTEKVLSTAIQADTASDSSMANRAVEYGKYLYCQQVVEAYDQAKE